MDMSKNHTASNNLKSVNRGYTLIELLIVTMIIVMLSTLGIVRYRDFQRRQSLTAAVRTLTGDLRFAQEKALAGNKPAGCTTLVGYVLHRASATSYDVRVRCLPGPTDTVTKSTSQVGFAQKHPGITFNAFSDIVFKVLGGGVQSAVTVTLTQGNTSFTKTVTVSQGGEIQ